MGSAALPAVMQSGWSTTLLGGFHVIPNISMVHDIEPISWADGISTESCGEIHKLMGELSLSYISMVTTCKFSQAALVKPI